MKSIVHNVYRAGGAGLSNLIMSVELGVVIASLTDRVLVLKGNKSPVANIVQYDGLVRNTYPSRVTDLIDLGVPWMEWDETFAARYVEKTICDVAPWEAVFYYPPNLSLDNDDFRSFARGRDRHVTIDDALEHVPAIAFTGGKQANTLGYYSSFFYLDRAAQLTAYDALKRMKPKEPISVFAERVAQSLGTFNAAHIRRGDFKQTIGVTTLERRPAEVIEALDQHFGRDELLVILTDEADDPFFDDIKATFGHHIFLDHHILENYHSEFSDLPSHDSIALAYISQLVAARSTDFIGTMTSTFTALIQRMRGNLGKEELFKYLWNELPPEGVKLEPGRHEIGDDIQLINGVMKEDQSGPYSWNRVNSRLNLSWMREWPESILDQATMAERAGKRQHFYSATAHDAADRSVAGPARVAPTFVSFLGTTVTVNSDDAMTRQTMANLFVQMASPSAKNLVGEVRIDVYPASAQVLVDGKIAARGRKGADLLRRAYREVVSLFIHAHPDHVWLHAACAAGANGAIMLPGSWGRGKSSLTLELCKRGWSFLSDDIVPLNPFSKQAIPFPGTPQVRKRTEKVLSRSQIGTLSKRAVPLDPDQVSRDPNAVSMVVFPEFVSNATASMSPISPAQAVGKLLENCLSFPKNDDATIQALCDMIKDVPLYGLQFDQVDEAANLLIEAYATRKLDEKMPLVS